MLRTAWKGRQRLGDRIVTEKEHLNYFALSSY